MHLKTLKRSRFFLIASLADHDVFYRPDVRVRASGQGREGEGEGSVATAFEVGVIPAMAYLWLEVCNPC